MNTPLSIGFQWLAHGLGLKHPEAQSDEAAGLDIRAAVPATDPIVIEPGQWQLVPCGFSMSLPKGYEAQVRPRSGLAAKFGVTVLNAPGTIDSDYRGEVMVILINHGAEPFEVQRGDRIAQLVVAPVTHATFTLATALSATARGAQGFGSTGHQDE